MSRIRYGVNVELEEAADELIKQSFQDTPDPEAKALILTKYMLDNRLKREVYTNDGVPDGAIRRGSFHRALNTRSLYLNASEGVTRPRRLPSRVDE